MASKIENGKKGKWGGTRQRSGAKPKYSEQTKTIACHKLGLEFTGYELDAMYYDKACKRIQGYVNQLALW